MEYNSSMKISAIKKDMRISLMNEIEEFLKSKYECVGQISANKIGVVVGTYTDTDGFTSDTCCTVHIEAKPFYDKDSYIKEDGKASRAIKTFDLLTEISNFKNGVEE